MLEKYDDWLKDAPRKRILFEGGPENEVEELYRRYMEWLNSGLMPDTVFLENRNVDEDLKTCLIAAEDGDAVAQFLVGLMHEIGIGLECDRNEAIHWYRRAALKNLSDAQYRLGELYMDFDNYHPRRAARWFRRAAVLGHEEAQKELCELHLTGEGVGEPSQEKALYWKYYNYKVAQFYAD